ILSGDGNAIVLPIADLAVTQRHSVGFDLDQGALAPFSVHQNVLVDTRLADPEPSHPFWIGQATGVASRADRRAIITVLDFLWTHTSTERGALGIDPQITSLGIREARVDSVESRRLGHR